LAAAPFGVIQWVLSTHGTVGLFGPRDTTLHRECVTLYAVRLGPYEGANAVIREGLQNRIGKLGLNLSGPG
jgi:hypothetical protein